jgi:large subunit ribosomal protein L25|tara:strand:- start:655 stop:1323 length:669 start_codon:yes stop_codon:yes gene_type:complete
MANSVLEIKVQKRDVVGKNVRFLRKNGKTPIHLYGNGVESVSLEIETDELTRLLNRAGPNTPVSITIDNDSEPRFTYLREVQKHPVTEKVLHVDFLEVSTTEEIISNISVGLIGESPAIKSYGGRVNQTMRTIRVSALPKDLPERLEIDLSFLDTFEKVLRVSDIEISSDVTLLTDSESVVVRISAPRRAATTGGGSEIEEEVTSNVAPSDEGAEEEITEGQ